MKKFAYLLVFFTTQTYTAAQDITNKIITIYKQATDDYIGEAISQLEHALQAGQQALYSYNPEQGIDDETVIAAFLHDIGHRFLDTNVQNMDGYGVFEHEKIGAQFL